MVILVPSEPVLDFIIRPARHIRPRYPDFFHQLMHPEMELAGLPEYDLRDVEPWLHDDQKLRLVVGNTIYKYLQESDTLATCLNLQDGFAIKEKGIAVFRKLFADKALLWGSVIEDSYGKLRVPYLYVHSGTVMLRWGWLKHRFGPLKPALRFSKAA